MDLKAMINKMMQTPGSVQAKADKGKKPSKRVKQFREGLKLDKPKAKKKKDKKKEY